jgi:hypothetical protein
MRNQLTWFCATGLTVWCSQGLVAAPSHPSHQGASPWSFTSVAEPSSRFVVNDTDSATIDVYLLRSQGPIVIDITTRRYVGPTDVNGYLLNLAELRSRGIVGDAAYITLPAYDVDETTPPNTDCDFDGVVDVLASEIDELFLNDERIGTLTGSNNRWMQNSFSVPIGKLKFPSEPGESATNQFRLDIDVGNRDVVLSSGRVGCDRWAVTIDWIGVKYELSSPVVMVHGINSSGHTFDRFRLGLEAAFVMANDLSIDLLDPAAPDVIPAGCPDIAYNNSIEAHVSQLREQVAAIAERCGSETVHLVAHSKGGLDARGFLSGLLSAPLSVQVGSMGGEPVRRNLEGRSLVTLDTPHAGSVLAQYGVEARQLTAAQAFRSDLSSLVAKTLEGSYYCDLVPARTGAFIVSTSLSPATRRASVGSDADCNADHDFSYLTICPDGQVELELFPYGAPAALRLYDLVGSVSSVVISVTPVRLGPDLIAVAETPTISFQRNDLIVSEASAILYSPYDITGWHHLDVHSPQNGRVIAGDAQTGGLVDWRKR